MTTTPRPVEGTLQQRIIACADHDLLAIEICEATGASRSYVRLVLRMCALPFRRLPSKSPYQIEWPASRIEALVSLWGQGLSLTQIGLRLGVSRNAVGGKSRRMDLPRRRSPIEQKPRSVRVHCDTKQPLKPRPIERLREPGPGVSLLDMKWTQCSWVLGEPRDCRCCGERVKPGTAFCEHHHAIVYRSAADIPKILMLPVERRKRRAA
jgi:GcrA cell cycle regulator